MKTSEISAPTHWSKDFVEHLRTVHFALIGASAGLVLLVASAKPYNPTTALKQLDEIIRLEKEWSPTWALSTLGADKTEGGCAKTGRGTSGIQFVNGSVRQIAGKFHWAKVDRTAPLNVTFVLPATSWFRPGLLSFTSSPIDEFKLPRAEPKLFTNLADFHRLWNSLPNPKTPQTKDLNTLQTYEVDVPLEVCSEGALMDDDDRTTFIILSGEDASVSRNDSRRINLFVDRASRSGQFGYMGEVANAKGQKVFFAFGSTAKLTLDKAKLATAAQFAGRHRGSFEESFSDLDQASREFQGLDLEDVKSFISEEAAKGTEVFEAFGMKIPAGQLTLGGIVLVLSIQLYFLIYLRQLLGKLEVGDAGWDVPWMGMDQSLLARLVFFATVVLLPLTAIALLAGHAAVQRMREVADLIASGITTSRARLLLPILGAAGGSLVATAILSYIVMEVPPYSHAISRQDSSAL